MTRFGFDAVGAYVLTVALAAILVAVLVSQLQRSKKAFVAGLAGALLGILLGCIIPVALLKASGYIVLAGNVFWVAAQGDDEAEEREPAREKQRGDAEAGGPAEPVPARELTELIGKLELLTGDVRIELTEEQTESLAPVFNECSPLDSISEGDAKANQEAILAILNDEQKSRLVAIRLTRRSPDENEDLKALNRLKERVGAKSNSNGE